MSVATSEKPTREEKKTIWEELADRGAAVGASLLISGRGPSAERRPWLFCQPNPVQKAVRPKKLAELHYSI
jgi:hypothetical protein